MCIFLWFGLKSLFQVLCSYKQRKKTGRMCSWVKFLFLSVMAVKLEHATQSPGEHVEMQITGLPHLSSRFSLSGGEA